MSLEITKVTCFPAKNPGTVLGNGTATFNDAFWCRFIIMNGSNGPFVSWPSKKGVDKDGKDKWYNDAGFVIDEEADDKFAVKNEFESQVIAEFNKVLAVGDGSGSKPKDSSAPKSSAGTTDTKTKTKPKVKTNW